MFTRIRRVPFALLLFAGITLCGCLSSGNLVLQLQDEVGRLHHEKNVLRGRLFSVRGQLAANHDPPGVLARTLLALGSGQPDESLTELIRATQQKMLEVHNASAYGSIGGGRSPDVEAARRRLIRQGRLLLDRLLTQERSA